MVDIPWRLWYTLQVSRQCLVVSSAMLVWCNRRYEVVEILLWDMFILSSAYVPLEVMEITVLL